MTPPLTFLPKDVLQECQINNLVKAQNNLPKVLTKIIETPGRQPWEAV